MNNIIEMLEYFLVSAFAEHMKNKKEKEDAKMKEFFSHDQDVKVVISNDTSGSKTINFVSGLIAVLIGLLTSRLAFVCNEKSDPVVRILAVMFGFFFSGIYLLYYFLRYVLGGQKC